MIIFFTKAPEPGFCKSRLREFIDDEKVLAICRKLIKDTFVSINHFPCTIYYAGAYEKLDFLGADLTQIPHNPQVKGSLGRRMKDAIYNELESNDRVILIGSDLVGIDDALIQSAYEALDDYDIVIAPVADGGYGLVGMNRECDIFTGIEYSTPHVLTDTLDLAEEKGYRVKVLKEILDIDEFDDLVRAETGVFDTDLIGRGEYNVNYKVGDYVFRINFASQMGLGEDQIAYEYQALKELEPSGVTPKAYECKKSGNYIPYGFLTMEYLQGRPLDYDKDMATAARLLSTVHNMDASHSKLIRADKPFKMMYEEFLSMYSHYKSWEDRDREAEKIIDELMEIAGSYDLDAQMKRPSIINTELNNRNFIINNNSYIIDWEKPIIGDCEQDLAHFLVPTTTNWKTDKILSDAEIENFLLEYEKYRSVNRKLLKQFMTFNTLRGVTWCSMAKREYSSDRAIKNEDTEKKINKFLSLDFLKMLKERFY